MPAIPHNSGPVHFFFRNYNRAGTPIYIGTCETRPRIISKPTYRPVYNDIGGDVPFDRLYQGEEHLIIGTFTRWEEIAVREMQNRPLSSFGQGAPGSLLRRGRITAGDTGTLMVTEGFAYELLLYFSHFAKTFFAGNAMPPGYRFKAAYLEGPDDRENGTCDNKFRLIWYAGRRLTMAPSGFYTFDSYDQVLPPMPPVN